MGVQVPGVPHINRWHRHAIHGKEGGCGRAWARMSCAVPEEASSDPKRTLCPSCKAPPVYIIPYPTLPAGGRRWDPPSLTASAVRPQ